jgi:SAM-dependent methyltransferase
MSDEVRSTSIPAPADTGSPNADSGEGPKSLDVVFATEDEAPDSDDRVLVSIPPPSSEPPTLPLPSPSSSLPPETLPLPPPGASSPPPPSSPSAAESSPPPSPARPSTPAPVSLDPAVVSVEPTSQLRPQTSTELLPGTRHSERPPPPSQRNAAAAAQRAEASPVKAGASPEGPMLPPASSLSSDVAPSVRSTSTPTIVTRAASMQPPPRTSSLPPGFVEPKRIIEVLGSNVPVLDSALEEEAIEDLDESEAYELSETPVPSVEPDPEIEVNVVVEDFPPLDVSLDGSDEAAGLADNGSDTSSRDAAALDESPLDDSALEVSAEGEASSAAGAADGASSPAGKRAKAPPNKRRRPPPPSARSQEKPKPEPPAVGRKWWEEMFSEEFLRAIPILSPRQLEREVNFIDEGLGVARGGRILDLACGAGQHAVELAARGYDLVGFDLSQSQLDWAGGLAQERGQSLQFTYGDMRELAYQEAFDAVYSWNTSFGFFEEEKNMDVAHRVFNALRPGGRFLLDVINRDFVVSQQPGQTWFEGDGCVCIDDVSIDFITSRMKVKRTLMLTSGKNRECNYSLRIYGLHELGKILHDVGFKVLNVSGRPEMPGVFFGATSPRIIILAAKP